MKGISVKRIAELFKATPIEFRTEETDPGFKDNEKVIVDSFNKKKAMMSNDSSQASGCMTHEHSHRRLALAASSSFRGNPIRVKRKNISSSKPLIQQKKPTDWKATDVVDPVMDEKLTVDRLVKGSLFSKRENAFNLTDKHKMFFALPKKGEHSMTRQSANTKESTKDASKPVISSISIPSSTQNLIPKDASIKLQNLRQLYLTKVNKGPKLSNQPPMLSPAQQMIANRQRTDTSLQSNQVSVRASMGSSLSNFSKAPLNFQIQFGTQVKDNHSPTVFSPSMQPRPTMIVSTGETVSKRIKVSDRLSLLKNKEAKEIKFAPQNTEKFIG